ncbi:hypothetical protein M426DRAFT_323626 [Hypoxylon sp. CI-4A]|nr:hypothetical protein M426DRAFT_323626 [Hypoxylon sp. CI-4A]
MPQDYTPPSGPPPSYGQGSSSNYAPPPGPPPSHSQRQQEDYAPPTGPPPSDTKTNNNPFLSNLVVSSSSGAAADYAAPPGPPPNQSGSGDRNQKQKQKQHDWETAVPDTSLLPPPPNFFSGFDRSPANNATEEQAEAGESWCRAFPLYNPEPLSLAVAAAGEQGNVALYLRRPNDNDNDNDNDSSSSSNSKGQFVAQHHRGGGWRCSGGQGSPDASLPSYPPLYHAAAHSPLVAHRSKTIYYEVKILSAGTESNDKDREVPVALGFSAPPYPSFRLPGWHRGSLAVHGDDGHRYVNDRWGGKPFTDRFRVGNVMGLGMQFSPGGQGPSINVQVFLTRNGAEVGRWDLHEETDKEQDLPVTGLEGFHDICANVGMFEQVAFEVVFAPDRWMWRGYQG